MNEPIRVLKLDLAGQVTWQYDGRVLSRDVHSVVLEAFFNRPDMAFVDTVFRANDRFVETFFADRWYNIFEVHDRDSDAIKGWYCNVGRPAIIEPARVSYVDLALDLWVSAGGKQTVLDEDEFLALGLDEADRRSARAAIATLQSLFESKKPPQ